MRTLDCVLAFYSLYSLSLSCAYNTRYEKRRKKISSHESSWQTVMARMRDISICYKEHRAVCDARERIKESA